MRGGTQGRTKIENLKRPMSAKRLSCGRSTGEQNSRGIYASPSWPVRKGKVLFSLMWRVGLSLRENVLRGTFCAESCKKAGKRTREINGKQNGRPKGRNYTRYGVKPKRNVRRRKERICELDKKEK